MKKTNGIAIALAWPGYRGKQAGSWYDVPMQWLGINKHFHYKVGHSAIVLVNPEDGKCRYFDCGRYHTPYQFGRIRDEFTDEHLALHTSAKICGTHVQNVREIIHEIQVKEFCPSPGWITAASYRVDYEKAMSKAVEIKNRGCFLFGPFVRNGTNCCRFVRDVIISGVRPGFMKMLLSSVWYILPKPSTLVLFPGNRITFKHRNNKGKFYDPLAVYTRQNVKSTLPPPPLPQGVPGKSQWLGGEVIGSWFSIEQNGSDYLVERFSAGGTLECRGVFRLSGSRTFNPGASYSFTYLSHCTEVNILQDGFTFRFTRLK